jgi:hypothetical protein
MQVLTNRFGPGAIVHLRVLRKYCRPGPDKLFAPFFLRKSRKEVPENLKFVGAIGSRRLSTIRAKQIVLSRAAHGWCAIRAALLASRRRNDSFSSSKFGSDMAIYPFMYPPPRFSKRPTVPTLGKTAVFQASQRFGLGRIKSHVKAHSTY